jgi:hypothetical protein
MSALDEVKGIYTDAAANLLPLHRAIVFAIGFFMSLALSRRHSASMTLSMLNTRLVDISSFSKPPLAGARVADVAAGIALVVLSWLASRIILAVVFRVAARSTSLWERVESSQSHKVVRNVQNLADHQSAVSLLDTLLKGPKARLRMLNALSELCAGIALVNVFSGIRGSNADLGIGTGFAVIATVVNILAVNYFFADCFGPLLLRAELLGAKKPRPWSDE